MKVFVLFFSLLILVSSCTKMSPYEKAGYTSINQHIKSMTSSENWIAHGIGGSFYGGDIKKLSVGFTVPGEDFNIEYGRYLIVKGVEIFLSSINNNEKLIPHLNHYPFTCKDITYEVSLYTLQGKWLGSISLLNGKVAFYKVNEFEDLVEVHEEPYPEALHKIKAGLTTPMPQLQDN